MASEINSFQDMLDVRDIIERFEELEDNNEQGPEEKDEFDHLSKLLEELKGNGGDEQWRGEWYPSLLIRDSHFVEYAQELCEDIGDIPRDLPSYIQIDWQATARNIRFDY